MSGPRHAVAAGNGRAQREPVTGTGCVPDVDEHQTASDRPVAARIGPFTTQRLVLGDWNELLRDPRPVACGVEPMPETAAPPAREEPSRRVSPAQ